MSDLAFNETENLAANPDVAAAVKEGQFRSGRERYEIYGEREPLQRLIGKTGCYDWIIASHVIRCTWN